MDFLLVLIELFSLGVTAEAPTSEYRLKIGVFAPTGSVWPKISDRRLAPTNYSSCHKTRVNDLSCGIKMLTQLSFVLSQIMRLTDRRTDGRTDGQTPFSWLVRAGIPCSAVIKRKLEFD